MLSPSPWWCKSSDEITLCPALWYRIGWFHCVSSLHTHNDHCFMGESFVSPPPPIHTHTHTHHELFNVGVKVKKMNSLQSVSVEILLILLPFTVYVSRESLTALSSPVRRWTSVQAHLSTLHAPASLPAQAWTLLANSRGPVRHSGAAESPCLAASVLRALCYWWVKNVYIFLIDYFSKMWSDPTDISIQACLIN